MKTLYSLMTGIMLVMTLISTAQTADASSARPQITETDIASAEELPMLTARFFYYPNLDAYYDSKTNLYIYEVKGEWVKAPQIASGYRGYSIYNGANVPLDSYSGDKPYTLLSEHQKMYPKKYSSKRVPPKEIKDDSKVAYN